MKVCVIGLGYVGLTLSAALANKRVRVHGVEINDNILKSLAINKAHFYESGLDPILSEIISNGSFTFSKNISDASDFTHYIITVGTPVDCNGLVNLNYIESVCNELFNFLKNGDTIILRSTVKVGLTRDIFNRVLSQSGAELKIGFCPERTLEGKALDELVSLPQIISGIDRNSIIAVSELFEILTDDLVVMSSLEAAELVKLINNTQRDLYFSFANEIAFIADDLNLSCHEVIKAANHNYPRSSIAKPGPVGGPCLEKDPYILSSSIDIKPKLSLMGRENNESLMSYSVDYAFKYYLNINNTLPSKIVILGLAFKGNPETSDLRGTLAKSLVDNIISINSNASIFGHDPSVNKEESKAYLGIEQVESFDLVLQDADLIFIQNNHFYYSSLNLQSVANKVNFGCLIYDFWALHSDFSISLPNNVNYISLGSSCDGAC